MAFFLISAFWQAYDAIVPLILTNHFGLPQTASGAVMSIDNILAVFMLPIFGALSDKVNTRLGKRTPFILIGSVVAMASFVCLTLIDNYQLARVAATRKKLSESTELCSGLNNASERELIAKNLRVCLLYFNFIIPHGKCQ